MTYRIFVLNQKPLGKIDPDELCRILRRVHFTTLCEQYGLDTALIPSLNFQLKVMTAAEEISPYFIVTYCQVGERPILVHRWQVDSDVGDGILQDLMKNDPPAIVAAQLSTISSILVIELHPSQLQDMGLLLGYEVARWAGANGQGLVLGLDGTWYRLNFNHAFVPLTGE